jgi:hypothetical protein
MAAAGDEQEASSSLYHGISLLVLQLVLVVLHTLPLLSLTSALLCGSCCCHCGDGSRLPAERRCPFDGFDVL